MQAIRDKMRDEFLASIPLRQQPAAGRFLVARHMSGLTPAELAERAGVSVGTVRRADAGYNLSAWSQAALAFALNLDVETLWG